MPLKAFVQLGGGFVEQEDAAREHNHVFAGNVQPADVEQRARQGHDVCHEAEHDDADNDRKPQTGNTRAVSLSGLTLFAKMATKNEVVYSPRRLRVPEAWQSLSKYAALPTN